MPDSNEIRRLSAKWSGNASGWPKRLEWIEIEGLRGWKGQRFDLRYPIMAVVGENGSGKSTILQAAAAVYKHAVNKFAGDYFPSTFWDPIKNAEIRYSVREGTGSRAGSLRKPGDRWRGNPDRPSRSVEYRGLDRIQPVPDRVGYTRMVKSHHEEVSAVSFDGPKLNRLSQIMGRTYDLAKMALTRSEGDSRPVPVLSQQGTEYSCFHQGAGETTVTELLELDLPRHSLILIDEIESSLHPRVQRRLVRDFAEKCREHEWQVIMTTHSPYVLAELPPEARAYIMQIGNTREIVYGVSPEFAMTRMDDIEHPECDLYVEDIRAQVLLTELIVSAEPALFKRCQVIPYGAASVGKSLGQMVMGRRFPRPSLVFLDGDQDAAPGCILLGDDAPERFVFETLQANNWHGVSERIGRKFADVADACNRAMSQKDHHEWVGNAATTLIVGGDILWQALSAEYARIAPTELRERIQSAITDALLGLSPADPRAISTYVPVTEPFSKPAKVLQSVKKNASPSVPLNLFDRLPPFPQE